MSYLLGLVCALPKERFKSMRIVDTWRRQGPAMSFELLCFVSA